MSDVCDAKIFDDKLSLPRIGLCTESLSTLIICIVTTTIVQGLRHYLWDLTSVKKIEILSIDSDKRTWEQIGHIMLIQFGKTTLWVFSILLIVNANIWVILAHMISDVIFSGIFIKTTKKIIHKESAIITKKNMISKIKF
tara:strand:- start:5566 stop:5985 length:420 start_codon:yes stop_codon:yes gene_type:complete